ncbi:MAG: DUF3048 domain-containing protein, partial [Actinomycetota bacterium]
MRTRLLLVALALITAACSGGEAAETTTTTTEPSTTSTTDSTTTTIATTTTVDDRPRSPINGLPVDDADLLDRRALAVKIDNHWNARPQSGILEADAVFEILVEGGLTRFMAVFHSSDTDMLGPIRSGRPSDATLVRPLEAALAISGGQPWIRAGITDVGVPYLSDTRPGMFRVSERAAPHNLYGNTMELREVADQREIPDDPPPTSLWEFGEPDSAGEDATHLTFTFSDTTTTEWAWDGERYYRSIDGEESHWMNPEGEMERIGADLVLAIVGEQYVASSPTGSGSSVPATSTVGSGPFHIFAGGEVYSGTWEREDVADPFTLSTDDGETLLVPPGRPWISAVPD